VQDGLDRQTQASSSARVPDIALARLSANAIYKRSPALLGAAVHVILICT